MGRTFILVMLMTLGSIAHLPGQPTPAFDSLRGIFHQVDNDSAKAALANQLANEALKVNFDTMQHYAQWSIELNQTVGNSATEANSYLLLGNAYYFQGMYDSALTHYFRALDIHKQLENKVGQAAVLNEIGVFHRKQGDLKKARAQLEQALKFSQEAGDKAQIANSMNNLGVVLKMLEKYDRALSLFRESAAIKKKRNDLNGLTYNYNNIGILYSEMDQFDSAIAYFKKALDIRLQLGDKQGIAIAYCNLGEMYNMMGAHDSAIANLQASLKILESVNYRDLRKHIYMVLSDVYKAQSRLDSALVYYTKFTALKDSLFNETRSKQLQELQTRYETAEKDREIAEQELQVRRKNQWIYALGSGLSFLFLVGVFIYRNQRQRQRHLKKEAELKEALARKEMQTRIKNERLRISRDLHDNLGAELTMITSALDSKAYQAKQERDREWYNQVGEYARSAMTQLRETIWAIKTDGMTLQEFVTKVRQFAQKISQMTDIDIEITVAASDDIPLTPAQVINLYRVSQEALQNAVKYANTPRVQLSITERSGGLEIVICDEGIGFDNDKVAMGYGLDNMRERMKEINGICSIQSAEGEGTTVQLHLPLA